MSSERASSAASAPAPGPLAGVRVLDLTSVVLGPLATQILGDYGAEIIKVENLEGDLARASGVSLHPGMGSVFLAINRNKRSIALDLKSAEGREILRRLIPGADVLVHNMRVAAIERLGFGYRAVAGLKPDIVYCAATGFGQDGPDRDKPAFDDIIQAACGLASLNSVGREQPDYAPTLAADKTTGLALVNAVLAALYSRERTGTRAVCRSADARDHGGVPVGGAPGRAQLRSGAGQSRLCAAARGRPQAGAHQGRLYRHAALHGRALDRLLQQRGTRGPGAKARRDDRQARNANVVALYRDMAEITRQRTTAEWLEICASLDIPATPIYAHRRASGSSAVEGGRPV